MKRRLKSLAAVSMLAVPLAAVSVALVAHAKLAHAGDTSIAAHVHVNVKSFNFEATGSDLKVDDKGETIELVSDVSKLDTHNDLRTGHMRDKLRFSPKQPARMVVKRSALKFPDDGKKLSAKTEARLTLNGNTKPVDVGYTAKRTGSDYHVTAEFKVVLSKFGLEPPCDPTGTVCVKDAVPVTVRFKLREK